MSDVLVPVERTANPIFEPARHDDPHFRWTFFALLSSLMAGFPLGVARRALDEFAALAVTKGRGGPTPLAAEQATQLAVAHTEGAVRAARCLVHGSLSSAWDTALAGDRITLAQRTAIRLASANAMRAAVEAVDAVFALAGGSALYDGNPLQRCWRDVHAAAAHIYYSNQHIARGGALVLGQPTEEFFV
jgi:alkylation response protein AidB-like acyl-CoA dehydrogenase